MLANSWLDLRDSVLFTAHSRHALGIYCLLLIALVSLRAVLSFVTRWVLIGVSRDIEFDIRGDLLNRLLLLEPEFYVRNRTGELMSRATNDLNAVRMVLGPGIMYSGQTIIGMALAIIVMSQLSGSLTLWVLLPVPIVAVVVQHFGKVIHELYEKIQASLATLSAKVHENLAGVRVVRAYAQEEAEIRGFDEPNREYVSRNVKLIRTWSMFMPSLQALIGITFLIVLWQGGHLVLGGRISLGALIAFYSYLGILVWPMIALGWVTNIFQRGAASMGRLNYILAAQPQIDDRAATVPAEQKVEGDIEFRNLTFVYPTTMAGGSANAGMEMATAPPLERAFVRDINLRIPAAVLTLGDCRAYRQGGKTTLAALVARLWEAPDGAVLIDGRSIREWPLRYPAPRDRLRTAGHLPLQRNRRRKHRLWIAEIRSRTCARSRRSREPRRRRPGIRGEVRHHGGRKRNHAFRRTKTAHRPGPRDCQRSAHSHSRDDSLSSVDTQTEERISRRLRGIMRGRTTILIAHRTSTVRDADQIVVLRDGRITERGTHDEPRRAAAITPTSIRNSCWKKNSNGHEQYSRGREARKSLRRAVDAAPHAVSAAV